MKPINELVESFAGKFLADNYRNTMVTDEILSKTFQDCVYHLDPVYYPQVKERIEEMRSDSNYNFYDDNL